MPCLLLLLAIVAPRICLVLLWLFTDFVSSAYDTLLVPLLGLVFLPFTTIAYALAMNQRGEVSGIYLILCIVAVLSDLGAIGGSSRGRG
ncbi:MAG: hypothetical protein ACF8XB_19220 [Planctomycetota bacterium JB042]